MRYIRVKSDDEVRWINLEQVIRATLAKRAGSDTEILVVFFAYPGEECSLKIESTSKDNAAAMRSLIAVFDAATHAA